MKAHLFCRLIFRGLLCILFTDSALRAFAAGPPSTTDTLESEFLIQNWTAEDGLPQNSVIGIDQTADGYLWLATYNGLGRFDGANFSRFNSINTPQLANTPIDSIHADQKGRLWIVTQGWSITRYEDGRFFRFTEATGPFASMALEGESPQGNIRFSKVPSDSFFYTFETNHIVAISEPVGLAESMLKNLAADRRGNLWVRQSSVWHRGHYQQLRHYLPASRNQTPAIQAVRPSRDGGVWVIADNGVFSIKNGLWVRSFPSPKPITHCASVLEDASGNVWIGTWKQGLWRFDPSGGFHEYPITRGKLPEAVRALYEDREGNLWVGTEGSGLFRLKRRLFRTFQAGDGLSGEVIRSVTGDSDGGVWSVNQTGLDRIAPGARPLAAPVADVDLGWTILCDRQNRIWLGSYSGDVSFWRDGVRTHCSPPSTNAPDAVTALFQDSQNRLWVGAGNGLWQIEQHPPWRLIPMPEFSKVEVYAMAEERKGRIYLGLQRQGLWRLDGQERKQLTAGPGLPDYPVRSLCVDRSDTLWIGSDGHGLIRFKDGLFSEYPGAITPLPEKITALIEDDAGYLWLGTNEGIFRMSIDELNRYADGLTEVLTPIRYGKSDGLATTECASGRQPTVCKTMDGKIWFATVKGVAAIDPGSLVRNEIPPPVMIEQALLFNRRTRSLVSAEPESPVYLQPGAGIIVPPGNQRLEIHYTGLSYAAPERVHFRYRLEGLDADWTEAQSRRMAFYQGLPPGNYRFHVIASNNDGVWNETGATLAIVVQPWLWQTRWFQVAFIAGCLALGWLVYQWRIAQLEGVNRLRLRIAGDLHDEIGANLGSIGLNSELLLDSAALNAAQREELADVCHLARQTGSTLRDIVWFTNPDFDNMAEMIRRMKDIAGAMLAGRAYTFQAPSDLEGLPLSLEFRRNIFFMFKEVLHNTVKHSQATQVAIQIQFDDAGFQMKISDNGRGFDSPGANTGNGLKGLRRRAADLGGAVEIESQPGSGTTVSITTPLLSRKRRRWFSLSTSRKSVIASPVAKPRT